MESQSIIQRYVQFSYKATFRTGQVGPGDNFRHHPKSLHRVFLSSVAIPVQSPRPRLEIVPEGIHELDALDDRTGLEILAKDNAIVESHKVIPGKVS
jgi:hypothetical protein